MLFSKREIKKIIRDFSLYLKDLIFFVTHLFGKQFIQFEAGKGFFVEALYKKRGKLAQKFMHSGMAGITALGVLIAPIVAQEFPQNNSNIFENDSSSSVLAASIETGETATIVSDKLRDRIIDYKVEEGDTVGSIANKFGISEDTIRWQNNLTKDTIKVGQNLEILPVTGIAHKVQKGDTIYSISKKYDASAQAIVDFPFNIFTNDETFELAIGQIVIVPEGVKPSSSGVAPAVNRRQITPDAGTVVASGQFVWPSAGTITQYFAWYHKGIDIANRAAPNILAADAGVVVVAGWPDNYGYGNRVVIDHGNGYRTLYAHMSRIYVVVGQSVSRGAALGQMGTTGRSTGIHLHFEVSKNGVHINPLSVLQ